MPANPEKDKKEWGEVEVFGWLVLVVNDRKFSAGTVFFSHTKPASSTSSRTSNEQAQPNEQAFRVGQLCLVCECNAAIPWLLTIHAWWGQGKASMETRKPHIKRREGTTIPVPEAHLISQRFSLVEVLRSTLLHKQQQPVPNGLHRDGVLIGRQGLDHKFFTGFSLAGHRQLHVH